MIGLVGAHRVGKSTVARDVSEESGLQFVTSSASAVYREMGLDPKHTLPFWKRLEVQWAVLEAARKAYAAAPTLFISDRTPLDMAAYLLADTQQGAQSDKWNADVIRYVKECFAITNRFFAAVVVVPPGIPYVQEEGKPTPDLVYQEHIHSLILGLAADERFNGASHRVSRENTCRTRRRNYVLHVCEGLLNGLAEESSASVAH